MSNKNLIELIVKYNNPKPKINCNNDNNQKADKILTINLKNTSAHNDVENIKTDNTIINFIKFLFNLFPPHPFYQEIIIFQTNFPRKIKITPTTIMPTPRLVASPVCVMIPYIAAINPNTIINAATPCANTLTLIFVAISIHQYFVTSTDLKHLWVSLSLKHIFVFDTPGKDTHLPLFFVSVFYVCKSLNGGRLITICYPLFISTHSSSPTMRLFGRG